MKKIILALTIVLCAVACSDERNMDANLGETPVLKISSITNTSGTDLASSVIEYWIYTDLMDVVAWQTVDMIDRCSDIKDYSCKYNVYSREENVEELGSNITYMTITFTEVYLADLLMSQSDGTSETIETKYNRNFEITVCTDDGVGTMTVTEYNQSVAEYSVTLSDDVEYEDLDLK